MSDAGPLGINPLYFTLALFGCLLSFVVFLLLPRGFRVHYFASYPKRYAWSAKPRRLRRVSVCVLRVLRVLVLHWHFYVMLCYLMLCDVCPCYELCGIGL